MSDLDFRASSADVGLESKPVDSGDGDEECEHGYSVQYEGDLCICHCRYSCGSSWVPGS